MTREPTGGALAGRGGMTPGFRERDRIGFAPERVQEGANRIRARTSIEPTVALILGSGLGGLADGFSERTAIPYGEIPGFPVSTVEGHAGRLVLGRVGGTPVVAQQGRFHLYEGYGAAEITFPLRVMRELGARALVVTNAAGAVDHRLAPGDLMLIEDLVNFQFRSPLRGRGPLVDADRFVDLCAPFSPRLLATAREAAVRCGIARVRAGTYWGNLGPTYETPAEVRMVKALGGDAVGMSTVAEVIVARQMGMEVLGIACISNLAAGMSAAPLSHREVMEVTAKVRETFIGLLEDLIPRVAAPETPAAG